MILPSLLCSGILSKDFSSGILSVDLGVGKIKRFVLQRDVRENKNGNGVGCDGMQPKRVKAVSREKGGDAGPGEERVRSECSRMVSVLDMTHRSKPVSPRQLETLFRRCGREGCDGCGRAALVEREAVMRAGHVCGGGQTYKIVIESRRENCWWKSSDVLNGRRSKRCGRGEKTNIEFVVGEE